MSEANTNIQLRCFPCGVPLKRGKVTIAYLGGSFPVELPKCPVCGQIYIPEDLALGKMLQVEKALEDK
jgi:hypothetical protein